ADLQKDLGIHHDKFQEIFKSWFPSVQVGETDFETAMSQWLLSCGYKTPARDVIDYWHHQDTNVNPLVMDVVKRLAAKNYVHLYTATNQSHERIIFLRDSLGWGEYFNDFYYSARLGCMKHDGAFFARIEQELGFDPADETPLYFDDDPRNIEVASKRGWNAVFVNDAQDIVNHNSVKELLSS
ncbi:MAG: hypothetical protein DI626_12220, partial [Micavibrio aeruginosavorus]